MGWPWKPKSPQTAQVCVPFLDFPPELTNALLLQTSHALVVVYEDFKLSLSSMLLPCPLTSFNVQEGSVDMLGDKSHQ